MKRGLLILSYLLFKLFCTETLCDVNDNSNISVNELPLADRDDSPQKHHDVVKYEVQENQNEVENLAEVLDSKEKWPVLFNAPSTSNEILPEKYFPVTPLQYLPVTPKKRGNYNDVELLEVNSDDVENAIKLLSPKPALPFTLGQLLGVPGDFTSNEIDISNDDNNIYDLLNDDSMIDLYPIRKERSDEDILEQLEHDAIINNILPTMDAPYFRDATTLDQQQMPLLSAKHLSAFFRMPDGSPIPIILGCTPKVIHGYRLSSFQGSQVPLPYYNRQADWQEPIKDGYKK